MAVTKQNHRSSLWQGLILLAAACALLLSLPVRAYAAGTGYLTIDAQQGSPESFIAYQIFSADVADGADGSKAASSIAWASDAAERATTQAIADADGSAHISTAQDAAEWLQSKGVDESSPVLASVAHDLVAALVDEEGAQTLSAGKRTELSAGYWIVMSSDESIGQGQSGTDAILVVVGGSDVAITAKTSVPALEKQVLEDAGGSWQKQADATVGDDLSWRLDAALPSIPADATSYRIVFDDKLGAGLAEPSDIHVYIAQTSASWTSGTAAPDGWSELSSAEYEASYEATGDEGSFKVALDLVAVLGSHGMDLSSGVQVAVIYNAPLTEAAKTGMEHGSVNESTLIYPKSTYSTDMTTTPQSKAVAYAWQLSLTKADAKDGKALAGAELQIRDDRGRYLTREGTWSAEKATVMTGYDGTILVQGVDSGTFTVEEIAAPSGYAAFSGIRTIELEVPYSADEIVSSAPAAVTLSAESPLASVKFDSSDGTAYVSVLNTAKSAGALSHLADTGDPNASGMALVLVGLGVAILVVAVVLRRRGGSKR